MLRSTIVTHPCALKPELWDLDLRSSTFESAVEAITECTLCPRLGACRRSLADEIAAGRLPLGLIWAAVPFDADGTPIFTNERLEYATRPSRHFGDMEHHPAAILTREAA